jgi:hypothetical protein
MARGSTVVLRVVQKDSEGGEPRARLRRRASRLLDWMEVPGRKVLGVIKGMGLRKG